VSNLILRNNARNARGGSVSTAVAAAVAATLVCVGTSGSASAATRTHKDSSGAMNVASSWNENAIPSSADVALFNSTILTTRAIPFGASLTVGQILMDNPTATANVSLGTSGDGSAVNTLTIAGIITGGNNYGVVMTPTVANGGTGTTSGLTLNQRISIGASQLWDIGAGRTLTTASTTMISASSASNVLTKTGAGTIVYGQNSDKYTNSAYVLDNGTVSISSSSLVATNGTVPQSGPLGNGTLTINGGTITSNGTSAKALAFGGTLGVNANAGILMNGNVTIGNATGTGSMRFSGNIDLGNATRTFTLYNGSATGSTPTSGGTQVDFTILQGTNSSAGVGVTSSVANGTLALAAGPNTSAANRAYARFGAATPFVGNAGLIIGQNVQTSLAVTNAFGNSILSVPNVTVQAGGILDLSAQSEVIDGARNQRIGLLSGAGTVTNAASDSGTGSSATGFLVTGTANSTDTSTFSGIIQDGTLAQVGLSKVGASTQILTNANTYGFGTFVGASAAGGGTLLVNNTTGSGTGSGAVQVYAGTLGGTGSVSGAVTIGNATGEGDAFLAPGASIGTFTTTSSATFASDGVLSVELRTTLGNLASDLLVANGATIDPAALFAAVDLGDGTGAAEGTVFTVLSNTSANQIGGAFGNLADGGTFTVNGVNYLADYQGGDGNDLTLTVVVPEPASLGAIGLASVALLARRRRRSH